MKLLLFATVVTCAVIAAAQANSKHGCIEPAREFDTLDPQTVDAAAVDELHDAGKLAICRVTLSSLDLVQLCWDKGFDAVSFDDGAETPPLREQADKLKLPVVDTLGRRTTSGS